MTRPVSGTCVLLIVALFCLACSRNVGAPNQTSATQAVVNPAGELRYKVPSEWVTERPTSSMRAAQYRLPKVEGDNEDASLVLYYFGAGQGGPVQANIDRWTSQMVQPDGSSSKDKAKTETLTVNGLQVTMLDVVGTYTAEMSPGSGTRNNNTNYRLRAAVVETPKGAYFAKLIGPEKTIRHWDQAFMDYVRSFAFN